MIYRLEHQEIYKGFHLVVMFVSNHRCGYVGLPNGNKYQVDNFDQFNDLLVHGGITYSRNDATFKLTGYEHYIGFDCEHACDGYDFKSMEDYGADKNYIESLKKYAHNEDEVRTKEYVLKELYELVEQLKGE